MADIKIIVDSSDVTTASKRLNQLGSAGRTAGKGVDETAKGVDKASRGMNQFGAVSKMGGKKLNTFNMQIQQGGYQLQDFVVQLQSGTSIFTAFGQQGSQFAGVFGHKGAVIGAVIAIGSAVGGMAYKMLTAGEEVREFQEILEDTSDILSELSDANKAAAMSNKELEASFGTASVQIKSTLALLRSIAQNEAQGAIDDLAGSLTDLYTIRGDGDRRTGVADFFDVGLVYAVTKAQKEARKEARILTAEFVNAQAALAASEGNIDGQVLATQRLLDVTRTLAQVDGEINDEEEALLKKLAESLLIMQESQTVTENTLSSYVDILGTEESLAEATEALNSLFEDRLGTIDDTANSYVDILGTENGLAEATEALNSLFDARLGTIDDTANSYVDVLGSAKGLLEAEKALNKEFEKTLDAANQISPALQSAVNDANTFADAMERAAGASANIGISTAGLNAQISALKGGSSKAEGYASAAAATVRERLTAATPAAEAGTRSSGRIDRLSQEAYDKTLENRNARETLSDLMSDPESNKGSGSKQTIDEYLDQLQKEQAHKTTLVGLSNEEITASNFEFTLRKKISTLEGETSETRIKMILKEEELLAAAVEKQRDRDNLQSSINGALSTGLESLVTGAASVEGAFKSMLSNIILEIYKQKVMEPMVETGADFIMSFLKSANGNVFSGGSQVKAYANGGVVNGPTTFPMTGGQTGLMGEAGPEAIMPLKRGSNGKLGVQMEGGGGQNVVINQSFNFQANGDDTVKKLIAQAAPKIAQMTKSSLLDDRRRGGSTKAAFG